MRKALIAGCVASLSLFSLYMAILTFANSFGHALEQFLSLWRWMVPLLIGFGIQVGLFTHIREASRLSSQAGPGALSSIGASGGISTTSMVACCAHHLADVVPLLGMSAAAVFLDRYQGLFMAAGIAANLIGINIMLKIIQDRRLHAGKGILSVLMRLDMKRAFYATGSIGAALFFAVMLRLNSGG